jgi:hypothetical protein
MSQTEITGKVETRTVDPIIFFENHAAYDIMWKNTVEPDRPQMT